MVESRYERAMERVRSGPMMRAASASSTRSSATSVSSLSSTASSEGRPQKKAKKVKKKGAITICTADCKYEVVRRVARRLGMRSVGEDEDWFLYWTDTSVALERVMEMKGYQKINHFPGMSEITRKDNLARNLNRLYKQFPEDFDFFPKTWVLPADWSDFQNHIRTTKKAKTYIMKPESGCQGRGISLSRNPQKDIKPSEHMIVQEYLDKPFLLDGFKFDLRIYVLVTSCDPLRIFLYENGLARFATESYSEPSSKNVDNMFVHLTNYAINKNNDNFVRSDDYEKGSKRSLESVKKWFASNGYDVKTLWENIADIIIKTLTAAVPILSHNYRTCFPNHNNGSGCFEILGFDILIDRKLKPWVLEVNHSPSFTCDSRLDREIKEEVIGHALKLLNMSTSDKKRCAEFERKRVQDRLLKGRRSPTEERKEREEERRVWEKEMLEHEAANMGTYKRIYPTETTSKYDRFLSGASTVFNETAASKARIEILRVQREDREQKKARPLPRRMSTGSAKEPGSAERRLTRRSESMSMRPEGDGAGGEGEKAEEGGQSDGGGRARDELLLATARRLSKYGRFAAEGSGSVVKISDLTAALEQRLGKLALAKIPSRSELMRRRESAVVDAHMEAMLGEGRGVPYSEEEENVRLRLLADRETLVRTTGLRDRIHEALGSGEAPNYPPSQQQTAPVQPPQRTFRGPTSTAAVLASAANALGRTMMREEQQQQQQQQQAHTLQLQIQPTKSQPSIVRAAPGPRSWLTDDVGDGQGRKLQRGLSLQILGDAHDRQSTGSIPAVYNYAPFPSHGNAITSATVAQSTAMPRPTAKSLSLAILSERAPVVRRVDIVRQKPAAVSVARNVS